MNIQEAQTISTFISYSRKDRHHADRLSLALRKRGFSVARDLDDILPTEEWKGRINDLICAADAVVFLLSPNSAASEVCAWEVELATTRKKKIAPIVVADVSGGDIPAALSRLNYIFATQDTQFDHAIESLCKALAVDAVWIREHSRLTAMADRWIRGDRPPDQLLRGAELISCLEWESARPASAAEAGAAVKEFLTASLEGRDREIEYFRARRLAEMELLNPILEEQIKKLEVEADELDRKTRAVPLLRANEYATEKREHVATLRNFQVGGGRWHPKPAEHHASTSADMGYQEIYRFPCCGTLARLPNCTPPHQFRADGCEQSITEQEDGQDR